MSLTPARKFKFTHDFVNAMESINAPEYVTSDDLDLKSLFMFFKLYVHVCRDLKLNKIPLEKQNIENAMNQRLDISFKNGTLIPDLMETPLIANPTEIKKIAGPIITEADLKEN